jgi:type IV pilus biogenesis protein CpaD/CtpE
MRSVLLAIAAVSLSACGGEPAKPAEPTPEPVATAPAAPAMDEAMKAADAADDMNVAETADGAMFHTDTTKTEKVHLPAGNWTATPVDATQISVVGAKDEAMPDGATHHVVEVKALTKDVIAKVKFEKHASADATAPVTETRTVNFMVH